MAAVGILLAGGFPVRSMGQQQGQKTFSSPENAINALVTAAQNNDEEALLDVFGPDGKQIVSSGDETEDAQNRANFLQRYQEMHRFVKEPDGTIVLYIGAKNWPTPIPLVNKGGSWYFDTDAGKKEILFRRIGRNEISTIRVCQELVAAEKEYHSAVHAATSSWQTRMVDISLRPIRLNRISFLPASVSKYHELLLLTRGIGVGQFFAPIYKTIVPSGSFTKRCISWYLSTKLARFWASSVSSPEETICFPSGPRILSIPFSSLFRAAATSALLASSGDENVFWPCCCAMELVGKHPVKRIVTAANSGKLAQ